MAKEVEFKDKELRKFLSSLDFRTKQFKGRDKAIVGLWSAIVFKDIIKHFENEEGPGGRWKEWSDVYLLHMIKVGKVSNAILQDTGRLRNTFIPEKHTKKTSSGVLWFNPAKTKKGFAYAALHDEGGKKHPARPFMWLSNKGLESMSKQTLLFILEGKK